MTKQEWIAALRSGKYSQYVGGWANRSTKATAFCCLGVAGHLASIPFAKYSALYMELGMSDLVGIELIAMNDSGKSFIEIADWLETHNLMTGDLLCP